MYLQAGTLASFGCVPSGASRGQIIIVAEEVQDSKFTIHMQLEASKLDKKDFFGKVRSNPFPFSPYPPLTLPFPPPGSRTHLWR